MNPDTMKAVLELREQMKEMVEGLKRVAERVERIEARSALRG